MKRTLLLCAAGLTILLFAGCAQPESRMGYVGAETAKLAALEAASLTAEEVSAISTDMSTRNGLDYYQVRFEAGGRQYQYDVDALTGVVIEAQGPTAAGAGQSDRPEDSAPPAFNQPPSAAEPSGPGSEPSAHIGEDEAKRVALSHAGLAAEQATFIQSKLDFDDGRWVYNVEFYSADYEEYDYEIDAYTGEVISYDYDAEYYPIQQGGTGTITSEQARQLVLSRVPGASDADIREFETDYDDGALQYEGTLLYNSMKYEFEIDAYSGFFREWSAEPFSQ